MLFIVSLIFVLSTAYQLNRFLEYKKFFDWLIGLVLIAMSVNVLIFTVAGLLYKMNSQLYVILMQGVFLLIVWTLTRKLNRKLYPVPKANIQLNSLKELPIPLLGFLLIMLGVLSLNFIYVIFVSPNNNDSLMIHLARIGMWHQTGSWLPWNTPVSWQLSFPFHGEMMAYWSLLFLKQESLIALFPLFCGVLTVGVLYHFGMALFQNQKNALLVAFVWLAFPVVQLNLTSSRHDHISTFLLMAAFYFLFRQTREKAVTNLVLTGLSLALSVGTNFAVGAYLPGFALFLFISAMLKWTNGREMVTLALSSGIFFLLLSSPIFISNVIEFDSPLGPDAISMTGQDSITQGTVLDHVLLMNGRWGYQMMDCGGLPNPLSGYCLKAKARSFTWMSTVSGVSLEVDRSLLNQHQFLYNEHIRISEDSAWFGPLGAVIFLISSVYTIVAFVKERNAFNLGIVSFLFTMPFSLALLRAGWTPYDGRYFIFLFALLCISAGAFLSKGSPKVQKMILWLSIIISILVVGITILMNPAKSFYGYRAFYRTHRFDQISSQSSFTKEMLYLVDQTVPEDATLGIAFSGHSFYEYGLFGEKFTRRIIPVYPLENICDKNWLDDQVIDYILINVEDPDLPTCDVKGFEYRNSMRQWLVYGRD